MREFEEKYPTAAASKTHEYFEDYFVKFEYMYRELLRTSLKNEPR